MSGSDDRVFAQAQSPFLFCVLLSVYARESVEALGECLASIDRQTQPPQQVVIVKDGPLPQPLNDLLTAYGCAQEERVTIVSLPENRGLAEALAHGLRFCRYDLVARMDSDDICAPGRFEKQQKLFERNPQLDIAGGQIQEFVGTVDHPTALRRVPLGHEEILRFSRRRNPFNHMTVMFRKSSVLAAGGYQSTGLFEDYDLWVRMLRRGCRACNLNDILVYARTDGMAKRRGGMGYARDILLFQKRLLQYRWISPCQAASNCILRIAVSCMPSSLRTFLYNRFLRQSS